MHEKIKDYFASNLVSIFWSSILCIGGLLLITYYYSIKFIPEFNLESSITLLAAISITSISLTMILAVTMIFPGVFWNGVWYEKTKLNYTWKTTSDFKNFVYTSLWFVVPIIIIYSSIYTSYYYNLWWITLIPLSLFLFYITLRIKTNFDRKTRLSEVLSMLFCGAINSVFISLPTLIILLMIKNAPSTQQVSPEFLVLLSFVFLLFSNIATVQIPTTGQDRSPKRIFLSYLAIAIITMLVILSNIEGFSQITFKVIRAYKIGNFEFKEMILKNDSCIAISALEIAPNDTSTKALPENFCRLSNGVILSRLGNEFYIQKNNNKFIIKKDDVVSWLN